MTPAIPDFPRGPFPCRTPGGSAEVLSGRDSELSEGHSLDIWMDVRASAADGQRVQLPMYVNVCG